MGVNTIQLSQTHLQKATAKGIAAVKSVLSEKGAKVPKTPFQKVPNFI